MPTKTLGRYTFKTKLIVDGKERLVYSKKEFVHPTIIIHPGNFVNCEPLEPICVEHMFFLINGAMEEAFIVICKNQKIVCKDNIVINT